MGDELNILQEQEQQEIVIQAGQDVLMQEDEQEQLRQKQELERRRELMEQNRRRVEAVREQCRVLLPQATIEGRAYAVRSSENISARKRRVKMAVKGTALHSRAKNARLAQEGQNTYLQERKSLVDSVRKNLEIRNENNFALLSHFLEEGQEERNRILLGGAVQEFRITDGAARECIRQMMELDLGGLDFRTDRKVVENTRRMERISEKVRGMWALRKHYPEIVDLVPEEDRAAFEEKCNQAYFISNYYEIRRKIITNPYYSSHNNSEISMRYNRTDTLEQKNLCMLLWQAEKRLADVGAAGKALWIDRVNVQDSDPGEVAAVRARSAFSDTEYGKNRTEIEDSLHAEYMRAHEREEDPIRQRLTVEKYQVSGMDVSMTEPLLRHMSNLPRWKAAQHMSVEDFRQMVENLAAVPANPDNAVAIEECKERNLEGLRTFKGLMKKQARYLKEKYGNGFPLLESETVSAHLAEFENDFTNMQGLTRTVDYLKHVGLFDETDPSDAEMEEALEYYGNITVGEAMARKDFVHPDSVKSYADYKKDTARNMVAGHWTPGTGFATARITDTMHLDVRWDTVFDENDIRFSELLPQFRSGAFETRLEKALENSTAQEAGNFRWMYLFRELRTMQGSDAARRIVEKELPGIITPERIREIREGGLRFGSITVPGVGTDDFVRINDIYRNIIAHPEIRADYGLDNAEDYAEFRRHLEREADMVETIQCAGDKSLLAFQMYDQVLALAQNAEGNARRLLLQLAGDLQTVATSYDEEQRVYRNREGNRIYEEFVNFRNRIGMFYYPEHKEVFARLEQLAEEEIPDVQFTVSGLKVQTYADGPLMSLLLNKELKEGTDPGEFEETVREFNECYTKHVTYSRMTSAGEDFEKMAEEPLWDAVQRHRAFFQYDLMNRQSENSVRFTELLKRIGDMLA